MYTKDYNKIVLNHGGLHPNIPTDQETRGHSTTNESSMDTTSTNTHTTYTHHVHTPRTHTYTHTYTYTYLTLRDDLFLHPSLLRGTTTRNKESIYQRFLQLARDVERWIVSFTNTVTHCYHFFRHEHFQHTHHVPPRYLVPLVAGCGFRLLHLVR